MAHEAQKKFVEYVKEQVPCFFYKVRVLDIGSRDVNGNNKIHFPCSDYTGVDVSPGKNVDIVCFGHEFNSEEKFDVTISTECFEHDKYWYKTLENMYNLTKPGGLLMFSCATTGRPEHGTKRTCKDEDWCQDEWEDYYLNLTESDIRCVFNVDKQFSVSQFITNKVDCDLYFFGIKIPDGMLKYDMKL